MAHVRVYCGLASANPPQQLAVGSSSLAATVVDDAGRLLDVCDLGDDPYGYAYLSTLLAERASGPYSVAIAADSDQRLVPALLATAGWAVAFVDDESTDDFAERFADALSTETESAPAQRRAVGLARALHAGALSAASLPAPSGLAGLRPVLAAHGALASGRHAAAMALREVLRELYPAALRAYPDPADPVALAVMDALPEPGALASSPSGRGRDAADAVTARLAAAGVADQAAVNEAITALRVAIAETPRRGGVSRGLNETVAETVRQAVAAVRACDAASSTLVRALVDRMAGSAPAATAAAPPAAAGGTLAGAPAARHGPAGSPVAASASVPRHQAAAPQPTSPAPSHAAAAPPQPVSPPPQPPAPPPATPQPDSPSMTPAAYQRAEPTFQPLGPSYSPLSGHPSAPASPAPPGRSGYAPPHQSPSTAADSGESATASSRPVSVPPPPPPGITPIAEPRSPVPPQRSFGQPGSYGEPAPYGEPASYGEPAPYGEPGPYGEAAGWRQPPARPERPAEPPRGQAGGMQGPPPGSRADWPTRAAKPDGRGAPDNRGMDNRGGLDGRNPMDGRGAAGGGLTEPSSPTGYASVTPPWRADDLRPPPPPEQSGSPDPPVLRLVEPTLPEELRDELGGGPASGYSTAAPEPPPLRLVDSPANGVPRSVPPVSADDDNTLLIFAQTRSAWFTGEDGEATWNPALDAGWQAAEQASRKPTVGEHTDAGLPRRVPRANLVPGSPPVRSERPLRVVRDPASIAAHTSGYFNGYRRGQEGRFPETRAGDRYGDGRFPGHGGSDYRAADGRRGQDVGGYPLGGRQRGSGGGAWDFSRDDERLSG